MAGKRGGLGKGLDALFVDNETNEVSIQTLRIAEIEPNRGQPRRSFDEAALADLADSIREHGVLQPLLVRPLENGSYQLVAGERRWRAARMAGLTEVPVIVREMEDRETMELALIENLQREDLNPIEEAMGYQSLASQYKLTQEEIAKSVGKSRPVVTNALRLLHLPQEVVDLLRKEELTVGHARALLALEETEMILAVAERTVKQGLTVREVEKLVASIKEGKEKTSPTARMKDGFYTELELAATQEFGRKVKINQKKDKGTLSIEFFNRQDLASIIERLHGEHFDWHE